MSDAGGRGWMLRRGREVGVRRLGLLVQTFCLLLVARVALRFVPVRRVIAWKQAQIPPRVVGDQDVWRAEVRWAVLTVARYSPVEFVCFPQCLAASELLRQRGIATRLHYGAGRVDDKLVTHTWLEAGGEAVIGGEVARDFSTLAIY